MMEISSCQIIKYQNSQMKWYALNNYLLIYSPLKIQLQFIFAFQSINFNMLQYYSMSFKVVENYQLSEENKYVEDGIQIYIAHHNVSKLPYLLKKVNSNSDKHKYKSLLNEIGILKVLSSPSVVECHKMLKTPNNVYLVYDYCDGSPLSQNMKILTKQAKLNIALQLIQFFKLMASNFILHCNLKASSIIISSDKKIKIINFTHGINRSKSKNLVLQFKPSASSYVAPQILKEGLAHQKSDFYSLGVILSEMGLIQEKGVFLEVGNSGKSLAKIIQMLMSENPNSRPNIQEVEKALKGEKNENLKSPRKKSAEIDQKQQSPTSLLKKTKSQNSNEGSKKIMSPIGIKTQASKANEKKFVEHVLKKRNLAIFLLQMSETCLKVDEDDRKLGIFLSYLLMNKSCYILNNLLAYLKGDKINDKQLDGFLDKAERSIFEKKPDFFKLVSTVRKKCIYSEKQSGNQKRWLQDIYRTLSSELSPKFKQIASEEQVNDKNLLIYIHEFLTFVMQLYSSTNQLEKKVIENLYLMSQILCHKSYEKLFEEMISEEKRSLNEQYLYIHVREMDAKSLITEITSRLKAK